MARLFDAKNWTRNWIAGTAEDRLKNLRALAEKQKTLRPSIAQLHTWQGARRAFHNSPILAQTEFGWESPKEGQFQNKPWFGDTQYVYTFGVPPGRMRGWADEVCPRAIDHTGWWMDNEGDGSNGTMRGAVFQLPSRGAVPYYYPAMFWSENGEWIFWPLENADLDTEVAHWADTYARRYAEEEREYQRKARVEEDILEQREIIAQARARRRRYAAAICFIGDKVPFARTTYRELIEGALVESRVAYQKIQRLQKEI